MKAEPLTAARLAAMSDEEQARIIGKMSRLEAQAHWADWGFWARDEQMPPQRDRRVWLLMAGRGFGKTRAGAEWVRGLAERDGAARIALVAATLGEARQVMVEGDSGLLALSQGACRPYWEPSLRRLRWPGGAVATLYGASEPEALRGPQHSHAWCDEIAKWPAAQAAWDNLALGLRLGTRPRIVATTTPKPTSLLRALIVRSDVAVSGGRTRDNRLHLAEDFMAAVTATYAGTRLGRQELDGELIEDVEGALWSRALIERCRVPATPPLVRVVVGVDPPAGASATSDACGIVVAALGSDGHGYVLEDASVAGRSPEGWAAVVAVAAARHGADRVVAEANNGGAMVESVLRAASAALPVRLVHASHGKVARAEPVTALYEKGRVFHLGAFPALEDELCGLCAGGAYVGPGRSPDRADALVWALSALLLSGPARPGLRTL